MNKELIYLNRLNYFVFAVFLLFFCCFFAKTSSFLSFLEENVQNTAFRSGEKLKYKISYGKSNKKRGRLLAGHATLSVQSGDDNNYQLEAFGKTTNFFSLFMKIEHQYRSIVSRETLNALKFSMTAQEGKFYINDSIKFKHDAESPIKNSNDILSTLYKLRAINEVNNKNIDTLFFSYYYNDQIFESHIINLGEEIIKTKFGSINTIKWSPLLEKGRVFKDTHGAFIWTTANSMNIPVKLEIPILVGSIYVTLISSEGTLYNINN
jgi:hypothetical protein